MPTFRRPADLPHRLRDLNDALHVLHELAGLPSSRRISNSILNDNTLPATASHERVRSAFSKSVLPRWELVLSIVTTLGPLADRNVRMEKERFHTLWLSALRESRGEPDFRDHSEPLISATSVSANTRQPTVGGEQFTLNMTRAVTDQLTEALAAIPARPLVPKELSRISHGPGVYQLFHRDRRVYIGSAPASIEHRLARALRKLSGRRNIDPADVFFNFLKVEEDLDGLSPHHLLLKREKNSGSAPWNQNGFGNLDPGRRRDSADISKQHFDYQYPVNLDYQIPEVVGQWPASEAVRTLKRTLPYGFRYAKSLQTNSQVIDFGTTPPTMNDAMSLLTRNLGPGWQGTALLGHVILYPETRQYPSAQRTYLPLSTADEQR